MLYADQVEVWQGCAVSRTVVTLMLVEVKSAVKARGDQNVGVSVL